MSVTFFLQFIDEALLSAILVLSPALYLVLRRSGLLSVCALLLSSSHGANWAIRLRFGF